MTDMILLSDARMARISLFFPLSHGMPRVDDPLPGNGLPANRERGRVISGIIFVIRNGLRWRDVPPGYGPHKTIYNRFIRWSERGVFGRIFTELAKGGGDTEEIMIDVSRHAPLVRACLRKHLKADRTAASLLKKGSSPAYRTHQRRAELKTARGLRQRGSAPHAVSDCGPPFRRCGHRLPGNGSATTPALQPCCHH